MAAHTPGAGHDATSSPAPDALTADAPATVAALQRALQCGRELASADADADASALPSTSSPTWLDAAARAAGAEDGGVAAAALLAASTPTAWTAADAATRRAACRLGAAAMRASALSSSLSAAATCLAARGGVALLLRDDGDGGGGTGAAALDLVAAAAGVLAGEAGQTWLKQLDTAERTEAAQVASAAATAISTPPEPVFADAGGDPLDTPADAAAATAWAARVDACLGLASALAAGVARPGDAATTATARAPHPPPRPAPQPRLASSAGLWSVGDGTAGEAAAKAGLPTKSAPKGLIIEVIGGEDDEVDGGDGSGGEAAMDRQEKEATAAAAAAATAAACAATDAAVAALLAACLYCDGEGLDGAWAAPAAAGTALAALGSASIPALFPLALRPLRATLVQAHWTGLDAVRMTAYEGPGVYARALAGRQLAALVRGGPEDLAAAAAASNLLPVVLAAADDPAPAVQRGGLAALAHLATACPPRSLGSDRGLLLRAAKKAVVGCDGRAWPAAAGAAVAVAVALDAAAAAAAETGGATGTAATPSSTAAIGRPTTAFIPPPPAACLVLLPDFLAEGERHAHERPRSLAWLGAAGPLLGGCGAGCLAVAPRLFPLLLRWLAAPDAGVRTAAGRALAVLLRATWPRAPAHAAHVWAHLAAARSGRPGDEPAEEEVEALVECAGVLWAAGGEAFREGVRGGAGGGRALVEAVGGLE